MEGSDQSEREGQGKGKLPRIRVLLAWCLGVATLGYTFGVIFGFIPAGQRIDAIHLGLLAVVALAIVVLLWPEAFGRVKAVELPGVKVELLELKEKQVEQRLQLEDVKLIIPLLLPEPERKHLLTLVRNPLTKYKKGSIVQDELRHLRSLGLIRMRENRTVGGLPNEFELADHFELTDRGKRWVARYGELEGV
jgi:hypothetical protein